VILELDAMRPLFFRMYIVSIITQHRGNILSGSSDPTNFMGYVDIRTKSPFRKRQRLLGSLVNGDKIPYVRLA